MSDELSKFRMSLLQVLDKAIKIDGAAKGNVQLVDRELGRLQMVVQRGFDLPFLQLFEFVRPDDPTCCARAFRYQRRVIIPDVAEDLLSGPYLSICRENNFQAAQSTPIIGEDGLLKGVFSTYFPKAHHLSHAASTALDDCASEMARIIFAHDKDIGQVLGIVGHTNLLGQRPLPPA
jgi:hypothetical protein